jgi:chromosome segregation ATPase
MPDSDATLERRLAAVERAVDGEQGDPARSNSEDDAIESRIETLESRVDELEAAVQSVRGFLGGVSAVNESVEQRADAAVAAVERLERRLDGSEDADDALDARGGSEDSGGIPPTVGDGSNAEAHSNTENGSSSDESAESGLRERLRELR